MKHNYTARFLCYLKPHVHYVVLKPIHIHARLNSDHHHLINANCMIVFDIPQSNPKKTHEMENLFQYPQQDLV
jgi:hypothetical protein